MVETMAMTMISGPKEQRQEEIADRIAGPGGDGRNQNSYARNDGGDGQDVCIEPRLAIPGEDERTEHRNACGIRKNVRHERDLQFLCRDKAARPER